MASLRIGMAPATHGQFGMFGPTDRRPWLLWVLATAMWFQTVANQQRSQMSYINVAPGTAPLPGVPSPVVEAKTKDPLERIGKLKQLLDAGALTQEEFNTQKAKLLGL